MASSKDTDESKTSNDAGEDDDFNNLLSGLKQLHIKKEVPKILETADLDGVASYIKSGKCKNIITMAGAGISTSAGIPDFRSPNTGLYSSLRKYDLPNPECIFSIDYFKTNPKPFFELANNLWPDKFKPTPCHYFLYLLHQKGLLLRHYTQNIDTLERIAGLEDQKLVEAHGTFNSAHCVSCQKEFSQSWLKEQIFSDTIPTCDCCGIVKPDVVFFGESLPERFSTCVHQDFPKCDLLIVLGTSLKVMPFAALVDRVQDTCPRLCINRDKIELDMDPLLLLLGGVTSFDPNDEENLRDVMWLGDCDDGCQLLAEKLGWKKDLEELIGRFPESSSQT